MALRSVNAVQQRPRTAALGNDFRCSSLLVNRGSPIYTAAMLVLMNCVCVPKTGGMLAGVPLPALPARGTHLTQRRRLRAPHWLRPSSHVTSRLRSSAAIWVWPNRDNDSGRSLILL